MGFLTLSLTPNVKKVLPSIFLRLLVGTRVLFCGKTILAFLIINFCTIFYVSEDVRDLLVFVTLECLR